MVFLANENIPWPSINLLREAGYTVRSVFEEMRGATDEKIMAAAATENLVILTFDRDYGALLFKYKMEPPPAIVYFRFKGSHPLQAGQMLISLLQMTEIQVENMFTVIDENAVIRQRKLN